MKETVTRCDICGEPATLRLPICVNSISGNCGSAVLVIDVLPMGAVRDPKFGVVRNNEPDCEWDVCRSCVQLAITKFIAERQILEGENVAKPGEDSDQGEHDGSPADGQSSEVAG